jgi:hypothetical protein
MIQAVDDKMRRSRAERPLLIDKTGEFWMPAAERSSRESTCREGGGSNEGG